MYIKFYSNSDLICGDHLQKIVEMAHAHNLQLINTILAKYNILKYLKSGLKLEAWTDDVYNNLPFFSKAFDGEIKMV